MMLLILLQKDMQYKYAAAQGYAVQECDATGDAQRVKCRAQKKDYASCCIVSFAITAQSTGISESPLKQ